MSRPHYRDVAVGSPIGRARVDGLRRRMRPARGFAGDERSRMDKGGEVSSRSFRRHPRNEPGHNRDEDDRQYGYDQHYPSGRKVRRAGFAGLRQGFGQAPIFSVQAHGACGAIFRRDFGRGCGLRFFSQPVHAAFDRMWKSPSSAIRSSVPLQSHLIFRK